MALERNAVLLQEAGYTTATGRPEQSSDLAHGAGSIHESSNRKYVLDGKFPSSTYFRSGQYRQSLEFSVNRKRMS
jgi:hypothetical protein